MVVSCAKDVEDVGESRDEGRVVAGGYGSDDDRVEIIYVRNKNVLHILEGADGECAGEVCVHRAGVGVGKGSKTEHIMHCTGLLEDRHAIDFVACGDDISLDVASRGRVGSVATHVSLVRCGGTWEMCVHERAG